LNRQTQVSEVQSPTGSGLDRLPLPPPGEVHLWWTSLQVSCTARLHLERMLDVEERRRAQSFYFPHHRTSFVVAHATLRLLLGRYLSIAPQDVVFAYGVHGKPALAESLRAPRLRFNMSHSAGLACYAIGADGEVGVDVEQVRPVDVLDIAPQFFSATEVALLRSLPAEPRRQRFFLLWTALEAVLKATGGGLTMDPRQIGLESQSKPMVATVADGGQVSRWAVQRLDLVPDYRAALATEGRAKRLRYLGRPPVPTADLDRRQ